MPEVAKLSDIMNAYMEADQIPQKLVVGNAYMAKLCEYRDSLPRYGREHPMLFQGLPIEHDKQEPKFRFIYVESEN